MPPQGRDGWKPDVADLSLTRQNNSVIRISTTPPDRISFPHFEGGSLSHLAYQIAEALDTSPLPPIGSPLEQLVSFAGLPDEFQLWWDGFSCELACSEPCSVNIVDISQRLLSSGRFVAERE